MAKNRVSAMVEQIVTADGFTSSGRVLHVGRAKLVRQHGRRLEITLDTGSKVTWDVTYPEAVRVVNRLADLMWVRQIEENVVALGV